MLLRSSYPIKFKILQNLKQARIALLMGVMKVQDEVAKGRIQLPLDFQIEIEEEESCDEGLTLPSLVLCQSQNDQATERNNLINHIYIYKIQSRLIYLNKIKGNDKQK
jgi:hypothetical protein